MEAVTRRVTVALLGSVLTMAGGCSLVDRPAQAPAARSFVTGVELGVLRDDYDGWIGMKITVGGAPITATALGRYVAPGSGRTHTLKIVDARSGEDVASVEMAVSGAPAHKFQYVDLPVPVALEAGALYYVVTRETFDSDQWYHSDTKVQTTGVATCDSAVYWSNMNQEWTTEASENHTFGPVDFRYQ